MRQLLPILVLTLSACSPVMKQGNLLMQAGSYDDAAGYWLSVLEEDDLNGAARRALKEHGHQAAKEILDRARDLEAEDRHEEALAVYAHLEERLGQLDQYGVRTFTLKADLEAEKAAVFHDLALYRYDQGQVAMTNQEWADAISWFEQAHEVQPGFEDIEQLSSDAHRNLARLAYAEHRYEQSIEHYQQANTWSPNPDLTAWSGAIRAALGRYYLKQGACRRATAFFEAARHEAINEPRLAQDLATSLDCAKVNLVVNPFEMDENLAIKDADLARLAADKLSEQLSREGSEHIQLIDPTIHAGQKLTSQRGHRYVIRSRVSRLTLQRPEPKAVYRTLTGIKRELCPGVEGYYTTHEAYCDDEVPMRFKETTSQAGIKLTTSLKVVAPMTGEQTLTRSLESEHLETRVYAERFQQQVGDDWVLVKVGAEPEEGLIAVAQKALDLQAEPAPLPSNADLLTLGLETVAREAATAILAAVDKERDVAEPRILANVNEPVLDASSLQIFSGEVIQQPDPYKVKPPESAEQAPQDAANTQDAPTTQDAANTQDASSTQDPEPQPAP